ncbi:conserved hypothetical protein [Pediculus humanus corporis]|uniref:WD-repeat protein n=1 Tax=Pediculus humanus subsp. corporis TaxID=121224 RepID=E0VQB6_PEDHC|nr:uncharacterized protein Phum_PHUM375890 [Pediculus humanus corporis]EEB15572.1 conserved hypothetical protein [Pediculus humanus corporis]
MVLERSQELESKNETDLTVRALTTVSNGFAFSCRPGLVHFFEKISTINKTESKLMAAIRRSQLYGCETMRTRNGYWKVPFRHFDISFHTGPIGDLALCYWKPIFMTFGTLDRTVRIWNYLKHENEMTKQYQEDVHSISLHPTDKLRFMTILIDDLQVSKEIPIRECPKSAFSICGHLLAAVNRNAIQIISVITFQILATLTGHSALIKSLQWISDDKKLTFCGLDGAIYEWDITNYKRSGEIVNKGFSYYDIAVTTDGSTIYAVSSDGSIKEIRGFNIARSINLNLNNIKNIVLSRSNLMMFVSAGTGTVASVKFPIEKPPEIILQKLHSSAVTQMELSLEDTTFISCSQYGAICIWDVTNAEDKIIVHDKNFTYFNEILISKTDLEGKLSSIGDLTQRTYELEMEHAYQLRHTETVYNEKKLYFKYITEKDFKKARLGDQECIFELQRQKNYLQDIVTSLEKELKVSKYVNYGEGMNYMEMNWSLMDEIYKIRKKLKFVQTRVQDMETLIFVKLNKTYSPRQVQKIIKSALEPPEDVQEKCHINMENALKKAILVKEEVDLLTKKVKNIQKAMISEAAPLKKRKMRFEI